MLRLSLGLYLEVQVILDKLVQLVVLICISANASLGFGEFRLSYLVSLRGPQKYVEQ